MTKFLFVSVFVCSSVFYTQAKAEKFSAKEMVAYMAGCRKALGQANTSWDRKDIEMLCSDPYLKGKPNESKQDKARRMKLIGKTDEAKDKMMSKYIQSKDEVKPCFDAILENDPSKDLKDVKMLCLNPYLTPTPNESEEDQARRARLIKESDADKERVMDKFVVPAGGGKTKTGDAPAAR